MHSKRTAACRLLVLTLCAIAALATSSQADIRLPAIIGDNMVLQAGDRVRLWGWADPERGDRGPRQLARLQVVHPGRRDGQVAVRRERPGPSAAPTTMTLKGKNTVTIKNILVGEVWVCSGQSNMEMAVRQSADGEQEIAAAKYPKIRLFTVERRVAETPQDDCKGKWVECSPETVGDFSAVGYFFGRELHKELDVPVGLIHTSWGGTPAEAWTSMPMLEENPNFEPILTRYKEAVADYPQAMVKYQGRYGEVERSGREGQGRRQAGPRQPPRCPLRARTIRTPPPASTTR